LVLDASNRILIPKRLLEFSSVRREVILAGQHGKIEIWSVEKYDKVSEEVADFATLAEKILGGAINDLEEDDVS
jgi:MraZ protein